MTKLHGIVVLNLEGRRMSNEKTAEGRNSRKFLAGLKRFMSNYSIIYAIVILCIVLSFASDKFLTAGNIIKLLRQVSMISIIAVGSYFVMVSGGIDISTGANVGLTSVLFSMLMVNGGVHPALAVVLALCLGALIGMINGFIVTRLGIPAMIATLAMQYVCQGTTYVITKGYAISGLPEEILFLGNGYLFGVELLPWPVVIMLLVVIVAHFVSQRTKFGRYLYAVGGNAEASYLSGINDKAIQSWSYVICGALASLAGVILTCRLESGQSNAGLGWEFEAIIGAIIGGVSLSGGRGRVFGALLGAILVGILTNGMTLLNVDSNYQKIVKGLILIFAIGFDIYNIRRQNKK